MTKAIAFYLPQYYSIPENDQAWGKGFTEWFNVKKALPLFPGHLQPRAPDDKLGYYNLLNLESIKYQHNLIKSSGLSGICYWYYDFLNGKRILDKPLDLHLSSDISTEFCLAWANESWTGVWHGKPKNIIAKQSYPCNQRELDIFCSNLHKYISDKRYITTANGSKVIMIYKPFNLPKDFLKNLRNNLFKKFGCKLFVIAISRKKFRYKSYGFDAININRLGLYRTSFIKSILGRYYHSIIRRLPTKFQRPQIIDYKIISKELESVANSQDKNMYPTAVSNWDNSPRSGRGSLIITNSTPDLWYKQLVTIVKRSRERDKEFVFIKSWNEWAEGNFLEPDLLFGDAYIKATYSGLKK